MATTAKLKRLRVYPVKGMDGMDVTAWELDPYGLRWDRRWMVVDPSGRCITRREHPSLARVRAEIEGDQLILSTPHQPSVKLPLEPEPGPTEPATLAGEAIVVRDVSDDANRWISQELRTACRIVFLPLPWSRTVKPGLGSRKASLALQDELPLHLVTTASLEDLSRKVRDGVSVETLSPNLVIDDGAEAYADDSWRRIRIGDVEIELVKPWGHRMSAGAGAEAPEPPYVATLDGYRNLEGQPRFGQLALHATTTGVLRVGTAVEVLERTQPPKFGTDEQESPVDTAAEEPQPTAAARPAAETRKPPKRSVRVVRFPAGGEPKRPEADEVAFDLGPDDEDAPEADKASAAEVPAASGKPEQAEEAAAGEPDTTEIPEFLAEPPPVEEAAPAEEASPVEEPEELAPVEKPAETPAAVIVTAERRPDLKQTVRLLAAASLAEGAEEAKPLAEACLRAMLLVTAWKGDTLVGLLRGWTDEFRDGFIADVAVHPDHLAGGTAADLVREAAALHPGVRWVLRASAGSAYLGSALGWTHAGSGWYISPR